MDILSFFTVSKVKYHCAICKTQSCFTFLIFPYAKDERSIEKGGELKKIQLWL